jgi:SNF2 family DNA or RNA helicase
MLSGGLLLISLCRYETYLGGREVSRLLKQPAYPLEAINRLKTLCRHPFLIEASSMAKQRKLKLQQDDFGDDAVFDQLEASLSNMSLSQTESTPSKAIKHNADVFDIAGREPTEFELLQGSVKLRVLLKMCRRLLRDKHRILVFSQSKLMLDIIQRVLAGTLCFLYRSTFVHTRFAANI